MVKSRDLWGMILIVIGLVMIVIGGLAAYNAYKNYQPLLPPASTLSEAITNSTYDLINLAARLGFLGIVVWAGSLVLSQGIRLLEKG